MYVCKPKFPTRPNRRTFNLQFQGRFQQCMAIGTNKRCEGEHELVTKVDGTETAQLNEGAAVSSSASMAFAKRMFDFLLFDLKGTKAEGSSA